MDSRGPTTQPSGILDPVQLNPSRAIVLLFRGARRKCPNCGGGPLFSRWVKMRKQCPECHLVLDRREPDYFLGGYTVNFVAAELLTVTSAGTWIFFSWPNVPWTVITWTLVLAMMVVPLAFYPFSKTLWLAVDLLVRPVTLSDLEGHGENDGIGEGHRNCGDGQGKDPDPASEDEAPARD